MAEEILQDPVAVADIRQSLLDWYSQHRRDLAWRDSEDPYHIWISEVMLQQTRVNQMGPYFQRFVERFPTLLKLAAASEMEVLKVWEGLGYYARARNLHRAARQLSSSGQEGLPHTYEGLLELPGIGPYTAAAISSIAFQGHHPALDGNVIRVLVRLFRMEEDPRRSAVRARLLHAAQLLLPPGRAGDFNQALMELGASICKPRHAQCSSCPLHDWCRAGKEMEDPVALPLRRPARAKPHYQVAAGIIWNGRSLLIAKRPNVGLLGGLWEFPGGKQEDGETLEQCLTREILEELGIRIEVRERLISVDHAFSHFSITLHAFTAFYLAGEPQAIACSDWRWIEPRQLDDFPFPRADHEIIEFLRQTDRTLVDRDTGVC